MTQHTTANERESPNPYHYAILTSYTGSNFYGAQYNGPNTATIYNVFLKALYAMKLTTSPNPGGVRLHSTSRTDRGVHALRMLIAVRLVSKLEDVFRTTEDFCHALNLELSSVCKKYPLVDSDRERNIVVHGVTRLPHEYNLINGCGSRTYIYLLPEQSLTSKWGKSETIRRLDSLLKVYEGTHSFHNFTDRSEYHNFKRHMIEIQIHPNCPTISIHSRTYYLVRLIGVGFMKNQIRKMISLVTFAFNNEYHPGNIRSALNSETNFVIPMAPGIFLFLESTDYSTYDESRSPEHGPLSTWSKKVNKSVEHFRQEIYKEIVLLDEESGSGRKFGETMQGCIREFSTALTDVTVKRVKKLEKMKKSKTYTTADKKTMRNKVRRSSMQIPWWIPFFVVWVVIIGITTFFLYPLQSLS